MFEDSIKNGVGIVLTTIKGREDLFEITLKSIVENAGRPFRLVVVCNEDQKAIKIALKNKNLCEAILFKTNDNGFSYSLNMGLNYFKTISEFYKINEPDIIGYSCDDLFYGEDWLTKTLNMWEDIDYKCLKVGIISPHNSSKMEEQIKIERDMGDYYLTNYASGTVYLFKRTWLAKLRPNGLLMTERHIGQEDWDLLLKNKSLGYKCAMLKENVVKHLGQVSSWGNDGNIKHLDVTDEELKELKKEYGS